MKNLSMVAWILMIAGAINWGLTGVFGLNLVEMLLGGIPILATIVYALIGAAGLFGLYGAVSKKGCCPKS